MSKRCKADNCNKYLGNNYSCADFCSDTCERYTRQMEIVRAPFVSVEIFPNKSHKQDWDFKNFMKCGVLRWSHEDHEWQCKENIKEDVLRWWRWWYGGKTPKPEAPPPPPRAPPPKPVVPPPPKPEVQRKLITELSAEKRLKREQEIEKEKERERNAEANYQERFDGIKKRKLES
jgi:hypothetical protein